MLKYLAPLVVFGLVVFVHELGHFLAAKFVRVYAPVFAFGWGPRLWGFRRGETDYRVSWFPVGGFVAMASRDAEAMSAIEGGATAEEGGEGVPGHQRGFNPIPYDPNAIRPFGPHPVPEHRFIESKSLAQKVLVLSAGVIMNAILALVVAAGGVWAYGKSFGGQFAVNAPLTAPVIDSIAPGSPAERAGLTARDSVVSVNGAPIRSWGEVVTAIEASPGQAVNLGVVRGSGAPLTLQVTPDSVRPDSTSPRVVGRMGVRSRPRAIKEVATFGEAVSFGATVTGRMGTEVVRVVKGLFTGEVSVKQLGGPIRIAQVSFEVAESGLEPLLVLIAFLSINLAVLNLLPIPVLDGGQILIRVAEAVKGGALSARTQEYLMRFGVLAMLALFVLVMFNDIVGLTQ